ncbi:MAG: hypothetical protein ABW168_06390 [Sedimenticola sp.]
MSISGNFSIIPVSAACSLRRILSGVGVDCAEMVGKYTFINAIDSDPNAIRPYAQVVTRNY